MSVTIRPYRRGGWEVDIRLEYPDGGERHLLLQGLPKPTKEVPTLKSSVPLTTRLAAALRAHKHLRSKLVLCQRDGTALTQRVLDGYVRRASRRAGLQSRGPHTLRHTFCSHLAMRGGRAIQELAGHRSLGTTLRYMTSVRAR